MAAGTPATLARKVAPAADGPPIAGGLTTAGANGEVGPFALTANPPGGPVTLAAWEPDLSDGAAGTPRHNLATVSFTVR